MREQLSKIDFGENKKTLADSIV